MSFTTMQYGHYLDEPFNSLSAWTDETGTSFDVNIDAGAARIYELDVTPQYGRHNTSRMVDISG